MLVWPGPWRYCKPGRRSGSMWRSWPGGEGWDEPLWSGRPVAQGGMRPDCVVVPAPAVDTELGLTQAVDDLPIEQLVAEPTDEALDVATPSGRSQREPG